MTIKVNHFKWVLLNCAPNSTQLHPPAPICTHLYPAHFSFHPALCNTLNVIKTKISLVNGQFSQIKVKKLEVVHFKWKLAHMVIGGANSESRLRFLKFRLENLFLGKFGPKKSKLSFLLENWHKWYLEDADSYFDISFLNFET